jgi:hypothetical protein
MEQSIRVTEYGQRPKLVADGNANVQCQYSMAKFNIINDAAGAAGGAPLPFNSSHESSQE